MVWRLFAAETKVQLLVVAIGQHRYPHAAVSLSGWMDGRIISQGWAPQGLTCPIQGRWEGLVMQLLPAQPGLVSLFKMHPHPEPAFLSVRK